MKYKYYYRLLLMSLCIVSCQQSNSSINETPINGFFAGKRLCIIGDSISTFQGTLVSESRDYDGARYPYYYPEGDVRKISDMWWYKVANKIGIEVDNIINCSWSGSKVTGNASSDNNAFAGCSFRRIKDIGQKGWIPDIIFCYISCNDWAANVPVGTWQPGDDLSEVQEVLSFREAYALMLKRIKEYYPESKVYCLTILEDVHRDKTPGYPSNNSNGVTVEEWNQNIVEIADYYGYESINLHDCGITYENILNYAVDGGLHPNAMGMTLMANKVTETLLASIEYAY